MSIALRPAGKHPRPSKLVGSAESTTALRTLAYAKPGHFVCTEIDDSTLSPDRMKSLGICVGRPLELISTGDPMIVRVCGSTVGLSRQLAVAVTVTTQPVSADI